MQAYYKTLYETIKKDDNLDTLLKDDKKHMLYEFGVYCYENKDYKIGFKVIKYAAEANINNAQYFLANVYLNGIGTKKNMDKALKWFKMAAANKNSAAYLFLGEYYLENDIDSTVGLKHLFTASIYGCEAAKQKLLDGLKDNHMDTSYEYTLIINLLNNGINIHELYNIGLIYFELFKDLELAEDFINKAATLGDVDAERFLINYKHLFYSDEPNEVFSYYQGLYQIGKHLIDTAYYYGMGLEYGYGTDANLNKAIDAYLVSAKLGNRYAIERLRELADDGTFISNEVFLIEGNRLFLYIGKDKIVTIPDGVKEISIEAFADSDVFSVTIPKSVTKIASDAFLCCYRLVEIINRSSLDVQDYFKYARIIHNEEESRIKRIRDYLFINDNMDDYLFAYIGNDTKLELPINGSYKVNDNAFMFNVINELILNDSIKYLGDNFIPFYSSIDTLVIPNSVRYIGKLDLDNKINCVLYKGTIEDWNRIPNEKRNLYNATDIFYLLDAEGVKKVLYDW